MGDEVRNPATEFSRRIEACLNDRDFMSSNGLSLCTDDFVRYDRRQVTPQPPADRHGWLDAMFTFEELAGEWPTFRLGEVLAVRGDRLAAERWTMGLGEAGQLEFITVTRTDEAIRKSQVTYFFDPEQVEEAIAMLDRLHAELGEE